MLAFIKDGKLVINTQIHESEREELLGFISELKGVNFSKLYDINGDVSGIAFYKNNSDIPIVSIYQNQSAIFSFGITDNKDSTITMDDINSLTLVCKKESDILFTKITSDFSYSDKFNVTLTSENTNLDPGNYDIEINCVTKNYEDTMKVVLQVIGVE